MTEKFDKIRERHIEIKDKNTGYNKKVTVKTYRLPNDLVETFFVDNDKHSVQIFALTEDKEVLLVKQFRPGTEQEQFELPGGGLNSDEDPDEAAGRELLEETGYRAGSIEKLVSLNYTPYSSGIRHSYVALNCTKEAQLNLDPNEFLTVHRLPFERFRQLMKTGKIRGYDIAYIALDKLGLF